MQAIQCKNHPDVAAASRCTGCAEAFCPNCLVDIGGQKYCGSCKVLAVSGRPVVEQATVPCALADEAFKQALIVIICFGIILGPMAVVKGLKAKREIAADPSLTGDGKATAAIIIGSLDAVLWVLGVFARIAAS